MGAFSPSLLFIPPPSPSGIAPFTPPSFRYTYTCISSLLCAFLLTISSSLFPWRSFYFAQTYFILYLLLANRIFLNVRVAVILGERSSRVAQKDKVRPAIHILYYDVFFFLLCRQTFNSYFVISLFRYSICLIINPTIVLPVRFSARLIFYLFILSFVRLSDFPFFPVFLLTALFALAFLLNGLPSLMNLWTTLIDVFLLAERNW